LAARLLAIGDIHGCDRAFDRILDKLALVPDDTLVVLGDAVDRGPGTRQVLDRLIALTRQCRLVFIQGNHEETMLDALAGGTLRDLWLQHGGREAIASYGESESDIPEEHVEFMRSALDYWSTGSTIFVHANLEPGIDLVHQSPEWLRWIKLSGEEPPHASGRRVVCGHTPQKNDFPLVFPGWVCLDTCAYGGGYLTCLDVERNVLYQARQTGETRWDVPLED